MWILLSIAASFFFASASVLDRYLSWEEFKNLGALLFYTSVANVLFLIFLWIGKWPWLLPIHLLPYVLLIGLVEFGYYWLYYEALKHEDTSIVGSLFSIGKVFIPVFAFFVLWEQLLFRQYIGFILTIVACGLLSIRSFRLRDFSHALRYMVPCSILIAIQTILLKYITGFVTWETAFFWGMISCMMVALGILFSRESRQAIKGGFSKKWLIIFWAEEIFAFVAVTCSTAAISLADATKVSGLTSLSPVFILLIWYIGSRWKPHLFRENTTKSEMMKKISLFIIIWIGAFLIWSDNIG